MLITRKSGEPAGSELNMIYDIIILVINMTQKVTKQGTELLKLINASSGHMTADQIHSALKNKEVSIGIATVYRNLNALYDMKLINRVQHPDLGFIYDKNTSDHYHIRCVECDTINDLQIEPQSHLEDLAAEDSGYIVLSHEIIFEGICPKCAALKSV